MSYETLLAGAYHVEKTLDRSTYSVLCVGKQAGTGQEVRLRLWTTAHVTSPEEQQRIQAEIAAIQAVQHVYLLPILEARVTGQGVFLASESTQDDSLNTRLNRHFLKPLPLAEALMLIDQVGQALHALHEHGITHGNLTPQAIFFSEPNHVRLSEFYLHSIQQSIQGYQPLLDENIPRCWYMAPEQFRGHLNAQTDQYALGCLAYTLLTGRVPFAGSSRATLLQKHQNEQPRSLAGLNAAIPTSLETAVLKALAKVPTERYSSVQEFLQKLAAAVSLPAVTLPGEAVETPVIALSEEVVETLAAVQVTAEEVVGTSQLAQEASDALATNQAFADCATLKQPVATSAVSTSRDVVRPTLARRRTSQATRAQGFMVLAPMIALVLVIVLVLGSWLLLVGGHSPSQIATHNTTLSPTQRAQATATSSLQPTTAETVHAIGLHNKTPTVGSAGTPTVVPTSVPTPTPTSVPTPTPTAPPAVVTPILNCVAPSGTGFSAQFGYTNSGSATVTIPVGMNNFLSLNSSPDSTQNQPTAFKPGAQSHVFQVHFSKSSSVTWFVNGVSVIANRNSPAC